jgi:hypothetical protein
MADPRGGGTPLDEECTALLKRVRERCPGLLPADPLPPGTPAEPVPLDPREAGAVLTVAMRQAAAIDATGKLPARDEALPAVVLWRDGDAALAVELARSKTEVTDGALTVVVPVRCDQLPDQRGAVRVTFTVGGPGRPVGLLAATPLRPEGPDLVVRRWGEALTALAWRAVLDAAAAVTGAAGTDIHRAPLIPAELTATGNGLQIRPQARHPFDRLPTARAVRTL